MTACSLTCGHELIGEVVALGIGLPGPVEHATGMPISPPIMPGWHRFDVAGHLRERLGCPVLVDNDVNIMALGEHWTERPPVDDFLFVKVGTGIGSGLILGGRLHRGARGAAVLSLVPHSLVAQDHDESRATRSPRGILCLPPVRTRDTAHGVHEGCSRGTCIRSWMEGA